MQTILGSGGAIGKELAKALKEYTDKIRLVSRNPQKVNPDDELFPADLLDPDMVNSVVEGSSVVYVTIGFEYKLKVWKASWPTLINNVIDACIKHNCKLVFFDNIYMYDPAYLNGMTEGTPHNPVSKKGLVRAEIVHMIMDKVNEGTLTALIARAADFYGPGIKNVSMLTETVIEPLSKGKRAFWLCSLNYKHSYTYVPDAAKATALLGNTDDAYSQVWHLPTSSDPLTGEEWIKLIANKLGVTPKYSVLSKFIVGILGLFNPIMKEIKEMMYQYNRDYIFDSSKFENRFEFSPTKYTQGTQNIIESDYQQ